MQEAVSADAVPVDPAMSDGDQPNGNNGSGTSFGEPKAVQQVESRQTTAESAGEQMKPLLTRQLSEIDSQLGSEHSGTEIHV
jgi:hypothetical protein